MNCPDCGGDTCVRCSRTLSDKVLRYRRCKECGKVFYTEEEITDRYNYALAEKEYKLRLYRNKMEKERKQWQTISTKTN